MEYKDINNKSKGKSVRTIINETFRNVIYGKEGINYIWEALNKLTKTISDGISSIEDKISDLYSSIKNVYNYIDTQDAKAKTEIQKEMSDYKDDISSEIQEISNATLRNKGYYATDTELKKAWPIAEEGCIAYVGSKFPYQIWKWGESGWTNTGQTGGEESIPLNSYVKYRDLGEL